MDPFLPQVHYVAIDAIRTISDFTCLCPVPAKRPPNRHTFPPPDSVAEQSVDAPINVIEQRPPQ